MNDISIIDNCLVLNTYFNGSGSQKISYYMSRFRTTWKLIKSEIRFKEIVNNAIRNKVCIDRDDTENCFYEILSKSYLYEEPNKKTNMYLIKGDKVIVLDDKVDGNKRWYFINYKNNIKMWIKGDSIEEY